jgi:hypothetical protein
MDVARGGTPGLRTCMLLFLNLTLIAAVFCHCWNNADASSLLCEPPYTEPYVRWCGRTAEVTPPPTRSVFDYCASEDEILVNPKYQNFVVMNLSH